MKSQTRNLSLSTREEQLLVLASRGMTDRQISAELGIRAGTINTHWSRIRLKLNAATRSEAVSILLKDKADLTQQVLENEKQGLMDELSQRMETEQKLRESRRMLHTVLSNAPVILWSTDENGEILSVEGKAMAAIGLKPNSPLRLRAAAIGEAVPDDAIKEALEGKEVTRLSEYRDVWLETRVSPMTGPRRRVTGLIGVSTDVTDRRHAELELVQRHEMLKGIMQQSPTIIHVDDIVRMKVIYMSPSVDAVLGYSPRQVRAMGDGAVNIVIHPDDLPTFHGFLDKMREAKDGEVGEANCRVRTASGDFRRMLHRATVFKRDEEDKVEYILSVAVDIHDLVPGEKPSKA